jgi:DNA-binding GntR family transcriptional regulator
MVLAKIQQRRAVDEVCDRLREAILNQRFAPGERLDIDGIASQLGVSLTPVRNAVETLAGEGLIEVRPRSGTFVASLSIEDVEEVLDLRCALECLAAEKAAARLTDADISKARSLVETLAAPIRDDGDRRTHENANSRLHQILIRAAGNRRLAEMYDRLNAHLVIARLHSGTAWSDRLEQERAEHEQIAGAMARRDPAALRDALRSHILRAKDSLLSDIRIAASNRSSRTEHA